LLFSKIPVAIISRSWRYYREHDFPFISVHRSNTKPTIINDHYGTKIVVDKTRPTSPIFFPDLYVVFQTSVENLRKRKEKDHTRQRKHFEKHLKLTKTQPRYFAHMKRQFPDLVKFIEFDNLASAEAKVRDAINDRKGEKEYDSEIILEVTKDWLSLNEL